MVGDMSYTRSISPGGKRKSPIGSPFGERKKSRVNPKMVPYDGTPLVDKPKSGTGTNKGGSGKKVDKAGKANKTTGSKKTTNSSNKGNKSNGKTTNSTKGGSNVSNKATKSNKSNNKTTNSKKSSNKRNSSKTKKNNRNRDRERELVNKQRISDKPKQEMLNDFLKNPFIGFKNFDEAFDETRITSQPEVLARLLNGENVFVSGVAGSGKTTIINLFINILDAEYDNKVNIAVTASTGIAASLLGGMTIHSWAGLGISQDPFNPKEISSSMRYRSKGMKETDVLIIDEISMLPAYVFTKLDKTLKYFRNSKEPFGGVQLVLIGDFMQLPPVESGDADCRFAIETEEWAQANLSYCFLDKSYRSHDDRLTKVLNDIAGLNVTDETRSLVNSRIGAKRDGDKAYTTLFTVNRNVDAYNNKQLEKNPNRLRVFHPNPVSGTDRNIEMLIKRNNILEDLKLKEDATVILTRNLNDRGFLPNGSIGVIKRFDKGSGFPIVKFNNGVTTIVTPVSCDIKEKRDVYDEQTRGVKRVQVTVAEVEYLPLKLGYAITVHKSQGQTFDGVVMDLSNIFQYGLGYVALSRVRSLDDLVITGFSDKAYAVSKNSARISRFVKRKAVKAREKFCENLDGYVNVLTDPNVRKDRLRQTYKKKL